MMTAIVITIYNDLTVSGTIRTSNYPTRMIVSINNFGDVFSASGICAKPEISFLDILRINLKLRDPSAFVKFPEISRITEILRTNLHRNVHRRANLEI
jgi:hypothetical protein